MVYIDYKEKGSKYPVAVEKDSTNYLYLHKHKELEEEGDKIPKQRYDLNYKEYEELIKKTGIKGKEKQEILQYLEDNYFSNSTIDNKYKDLIKAVEEKESKRFKAKDKLIPILRKNWFDVVYINGGSGAGKTKYLVNMVNSYLKTLTKKEKPDIFLISKKKNDKMIDDGIKNIKRLDTSTFLEEPMTVDEVPDHSIIIFDDFEQYNSDKQLFKLIIGFLNDLITMGRTKLLKIFIVSHLATFGKDSTLTFTEASWFVFHPTKSSYSSLEYVLNKKIGWDLDDIKKIKGLKRVVISKENKFMIHKKMIEFIQ